MVVHLAVGRCGFLVRRLGGLCFRVSGVSLSVGLSICGEVMSHP